MNARKIINTIALVCVLAAIIAGLVQRDDASEFVSGFIHGEVFMGALAIWVKDL